MLAKRMHNQIRYNNEVLSLCLSSLSFSAKSPWWSMLIGVRRCYAHTHADSNQTDTHKNTLIHCAITLCVCVCFRLRKSWRERKKCLRKLISTCRRSYRHSGTGVWNWFPVGWMDALIMSNLHELWRVIEPSQASNAISSLSPFRLSSRVGFYVSTFQSLAGFEEKFHKEISRVRLVYRPEFTAKFR